MMRTTSNARPMPAITGPTTQTRDVLAGCIGNGGSLHCMPLLSQITGSRGGLVTDGSYGSEINVVNTW